MGLPLLTGTIASKIWITMTWAVYDGDVPIMLALRSIVAWRNDRLVEKSASWGMARDPNNVRWWKQKVGSITGSTVGTRLTAPQKNRKEEVFRSMTQVVEKKKPQSTGPDRQRNQEDLLPLELDEPKAGKWSTLEIKGDCRTNVDWINGHSKLKTR